MHGPECRGGGEDVTTYETLRWLQLLKDFNCAVTSTWANNDDRGEYHTWRAWGSPVCRKQLDCIMGPRDLRSTTWYLNKMRLRTWDIFPVVVKIDGKDLRPKRGGKGWAGWIPRFEDERIKFHDSRSAQVTVESGWRKMGTMGW